MGKAVTAGKPIIFWVIVFIASNAAAWFLFSALSPSPFLVSFFGNELATLIGLLLGVPVALELSRRQQVAASAVQARDVLMANLRRELQLLDQLDLCLSINLTFLDRTRSLVSPGQPIYARPDSIQLDTTAALKYEVINDISLAALIDVVRFNLSHIARLMDLHSQITYGDYRTIVSPDQFGFESRVMAEQIRDFCNRATTNINDSLPRMRSRIAEIREQVRIGAG